MPFSVVPAPVATKSATPDTSLATRRREISERASLLRRMGHGYDEALRRCQAYDAWEFEPFHRSPLASEVVKIVGEVYQSTPSRVTNLAPGA